MTRRRICNGVVEESVLDFFIICNRVLPFVKKMVIDEKKKYVQTNYMQAKKGGKAVDSNHFTEYMDIDIIFVSEKPERNFRKSTTETEDFTNWFEDDAPLLSQIESL